MKRTLLISVAAIALAASGNLALSQGKGGAAGGAGVNAPLANPTGPAGGAPSTTAPAAEPQATESPQTGEPKKRGAQDRTLPEKQKSTQQAPAMGQDKQKSTQQAPATSQQAPQQQGQAAPSQQQPGQVTPQRQGQAPQQRQQQQTQSPQSGSGKQGAAERPMTSSNVSLTVEQKSTIRRTVLTGSAPRVTNVNFDIRIGTVVPRTVRVAPLPVTLIEIEPEWRGYMYFVYNDEIIVVEPSTLRIVAVLEV